MLKKIASISVLGISTFSVMAANAAVHGIYISSQLGYANTHMKDKTNIEAINEKFIIPRFIPNEMDTTDVSNNGLAGRLAIGYQFNQNFALEAGYLQLATRRVYGVELTGISSLSLQQNVLDIVAKGIFPINNKFNVYGKLGLAYLTTLFNAKVTQLPNIAPSSININSISGIDKHIGAPEAAVGVGYDVTPNISVDTSWTYIQPLSNNRPGNIDFVAVGIGYNFG
ncbi:MAG: outer membrane beta-barrel protein [Pseudomonadota bacterium]